MPAVLDRLYATHRNGILRPTLDSLVTALKEMIVDVFCSVYIVIDALGYYLQHMQLKSMAETKDVYFYLTTYCLGFLSNLRKHRLSTVHNIHAVLIG